MAATVRTSSDTSRSCSLLGSATCSLRRVTLCVGLSMGEARVEMTVLALVVSWPEGRKRRRPGTTSLYVTRKSSGRSGMYASAAGYCSACGVERFWTPQLLQGSGHDVALRSKRGSQHSRPVAAGCRCPPKGSALSVETRSRHVKQHRARLLQVQHNKNQPGPQLSLLLALSTAKHMSTDMTNSGA